jgi:very-short-patch-repair endonuclease
MDKRIVPEPYLSYSRNLRTDQTPRESQLWQYLRAGRFYGLKFKRQVQIGPVIVDFSCREKMVVIELDGGQHSESKAKDEQKDQYLKKEGYAVLRFWNNELSSNLSGVLQKIKEACGV